MKSKDIKALRSKDPKEISKLILEARSALMDMRLDKSQNKLKSTSKIPVKKKEIAQMLTILKEMEVASLRESKSK